MVWFVEGLAFAGVVLILRGVAAWSPAAAWIVAGVLLLGKSAQLAAEMKQIGRAHV